MKAPAHIDVFEQVRSTLAEATAELYARVAKARMSSDDGARIVRVEVPVREFPIRSWLARLAVAQKTYWCERGGNFEAAGVGVADRIDAESLSRCEEAFVHIERNLQRCEVTARYYGGLRFDPEMDPKRCGEEWRPFGGGYFVLPMLELCRTGAETVMGVQVVVKSKSDRDADTAITQLERMVETADLADEPRVRSGARVNLPEFDQWRRQVKQVMTRIREGSLQKVVLARRVTCKIDRMEQALWSFGDNQQDSIMTTQFVFQPDESSAFVGASPEILYQRVGRTIYSEAIAGTRRRGDNPDEDRKLGEELLGSEKDRREIDLVRSGIGESLNPLCEQVSIEASPHLFRTTGVQHLRYSFNGRLREDVTDAALLKSISPTPAVCGTPRETALEQIRALESFDRGWYAGPVGWVSRDEAAFAVGIRSALVRQSEIHFYSGVGLVEGSDTDTEWHELETKIKPMIALLGT